MDYSFEIKNRNNERVAFKTITSTTKAEIINAANNVVEKNPHIKGNGYTCVITSFDWRKGKRLCGVYNL